MCRHIGGSVLPDSIWWRDSTYLPLGSVSSMVGAVNERKWCVKKEELITSGEVYISCFE